MAAPTIQQKLIRLAKAKEEAKRVAEEVATMEAELIDEMQLKNQATVTSQGVKGTLVEASRVITDADKLKAALPAALWNKITTRVLDKGLLEAHIATGAIDAAVVAGVSEEKFNKPFVKLTGKLEVPDVVPGQVTKTRKRIGVPTA